MKTKMKKVQGKMKTKNPKQTSCMKRKIEVANKSSCSINNQKCQPKSQNFLSQGVKNSKSPNSNILSKEVLKRTSLHLPGEPKVLDFIFYSANMARTRPGNRMSQQRGPKNPRNRLRFDELCDVNGKIHKLQTELSSLNVKPLKTVMDSLKEIQEQMNQLERSFNIFQYNLTTDWFQFDRQEQLQQQQPQEQQKVQEQEQEQVPVFNIPQFPEFEASEEDSGFENMVEDLYFS